MTPLCDITEGYMPSIDLPPHLLWIQIFDSNRVATVEPIAMAALRTMRGSVGGTLRARGLRLPAPNKPHCNRPPPPCMPACHDR